MKMTIVTDSAGRVIAAVQGHSLSETKNGVNVAVSFAPGSQLHYVDVDDVMGTIIDPADYVKQLHGYLKP